MGWSDIINPFDTLELGLLYRHSPNQTMPLFQNESPGWYSISIYLMHCNIGRRVLARCFVHVGESLARNCTVRQASLIRYTLVPPDSSSSHLHGRRSLIVEKLKQQGACKVTVGDVNTVMIGSVPLFEPWGHFSPYESDVVMFLDMIGHEERSLRNGYSPRILYEKHCETIYTEYGVGTISQ